jgi:hypothetical protein
LIEREHYDEFDREKLCHRPFAFQFGLRQWIKKEKAIECHTKQYTISRHETRIRGAWDIPDACKVNWSKIHTRVVWIEPLWSA